MILENKPIAVYKKLRRRFGFLNWWPGDTPFEIFIGAILTQQTSWKNVEKAITNIKKANCMSLDCIAETDLRKLEQLVKPAGYYHQKAARLKSITSSIYKEYGSLDKLFELSKDELRNKLLSYKGIGKETADSIILYAAGKPIFVIDAYTKRIMHRVEGTPLSISYDELQEYFENSVKNDLMLYKDMHAQFVELGKQFCKKEPLCNECPLKYICRYGAAQN